MDPITIVRNALAAIDDEFRTIHTAAGENPLTEEQQERWQTLEADKVARAAELEELERAEERRAAVEASRARWNSIEVGGQVPTDDVEVRSLSRSDARDRALKRAEQSGDTVTLTSEQETRLERMIRAGARADFDGDYVARRLLLTETDAYRSAFGKAMASATPAWTPDEARAIANFRQFEERAASEGTSTSGGYGVPVLIDPTIILTSQQSLNPFRRISRVIPITTKEWKGVSSNGASWSFDAEATEVSDDTATLAQPTIAAQTARGFIPYSIEIGEDYPGFASEMSMLLVEGYDDLLAQKLAVGAGSGSNEPLGIVTALDADTNVEVVVTTDGSLGAVDITKVWKALPDRAKGNATWVMGAGTGSDVAAFGDAYGTRSVDLTGSLEKLRNRPVEYASYVPDFSGSTGAANLIVVGDFRKFAIVERVGMNVELIPHLFGTTNNRPTGQRGWFAYARVGSGVTDIRAFRLLQNQ
jgi:HK97 family phage major capsid protein